MTHPPGSTAHHAPESPRTAPAPGPSRPALLTVTAAAVTVGVVLALLLAPGAHLGKGADGDQEWADQVRGTLAPGTALHSIAAVEVTADRTRFAGLGPDGEIPTEDTPFELGSITKTFTGSLLAVGIERGEVGLDDPVGAHLPALAGSEAGSVTLRELATHTSGIPSIPTQNFQRFSYWMPGGLAPVGGNPYGGVDTPTLLGWVADSPLSGRGEEAYSNAGVAVLGHALATAAGTDYPTLLETRLLIPLGMTSTTLVLDDTPEPAGLARPHLSNGLSAVPWRGEGFAPAGTSTRTTAADLSRYARAQIDGTAPGSTAMDQVAEIDGQRSGLTWRIEELDGTDITWHNGGTAGSSSILAIDRAAGAGVILLSDQAALNTVTDAGILLAAGSPERANPTPLAPLSIVPMLIGLSLFTGVAVAALRRNAPAPLQLLDGVISALAGLAVILLSGPWGHIPGLLWALPAALTLGLSAIAALRLVAARRMTTGGAQPIGWWALPGIVIGAGILAYCLGCLLR